MSSLPSRLPSRRVAVLISGRGSNLSSLLQAARAEDWNSRYGLRWSGVISNRPQALGLQLAEKAGLDSVLIDHRAFASRGEFEAALRAQLDAWQPDLIVLAGFMRVLGETFVNHYAGRLMNIHPALLPAFPGLHTHQRAIDQRVAVHGATVHLVNAEVDGGQILAQAGVPVLPEDQEAGLAARVLAAEHLLLPAVVRWWLQDKLILRAGEEAQFVPPAPARFLWNPQI
jgi:phosphoribosylglycinamide formyltransferase 1